MLSYRTAYISETEKCLKKHGTDGLLYSELYNLIAKLNFDVNMYTSQLETYTVLGLAHKTSDSKLIKALLKIGANPNQKINSYETPLLSLIHAANETPDKQGFYYDIAKQLLEHGAHPTNFIRGITEMHIAASYGLKELITMFIEFGFNLHAKTEANKTPADYARENGHEDLAFLLENMPTKEISSSLQDNQLITKTIQDNDINTLESLLTNGHTYSSIDADAGFLYQKMLEHKNPRILSRLLSMKLAIPVGIYDSPLLTPEMKKILDDHKQSQLRTFAHEFGLKDKTHVILPDIKLPPDVGLLLMGLFKATSETEPEPSSTKDHIPSSCSIM